MAKGPEVNPFCVAGTPIVHTLHDVQDSPATSRVSDAMSKDLRHWLCACLRRLDGSTEGIDKLLPLRLWGMFWNGEVE